MLLYPFQVLRYTIAKKLDTLGSYWQNVHTCGKQEKETLVTAVVVMQ